MSAIALPSIGRIAKPRLQFKYTRFSKYILLGSAAATASLAYLYDDYKNNQQNNNNNNNNNNNKNVRRNGLMGLFGGSTAVNIAKIPEGKGYDDYQKVYNDISLKIAEYPEYDENSGFYAVLVRLGWHASGTYRKDTKKGGSFGGTMIYGPEELDGANNGLANARGFLQEFLVKYPWISRGDLWTLASVAGIQEAGGPKIPWGPGRVDDNSGKNVPPNGLLPDASQDGKYVKNYFGALGFNEQESVALLGAHVLGRCHPHNSGYKGPWGPSFNQFTNDFYNRLLGEWRVKKWNGPKQYEDVESGGDFMMLPTDIALKEEPTFLKFVKAYAADEELFFKDFSKAFSKLISLGVTYPKGFQLWELKTLDDQGL
ncbi:Cytochrome c peroxidase mitochondrial [Spathaspora sp. JA1]|nr:Cytochrome c peroxidase mitochondrial [Spathaspora sp. JA1]